MGPEPAQDVPCIVTLASMARVQRALMGALAGAGAAVEEVADVPAILARLRQRPLPDLVLLEWEMSGLQGIEALRRLHESGAMPPVLLLGGSPGTAIADNPSREAGDLVETEVVLRSLVKSVHLLIANSGPRQESESRPAQSPAPGPSRLDLRHDVCRVLWNGQRVPLSLTEFRIVGRLAGAGGADLSHREIYDIVKGEGVVAGRGDEGYRSNVRAAVKRIRRKFLQVDRDFNAIRSYHGFGYRWDEAASPPASEACDGTRLSLEGSEPERFEP